MIQPAKRQLQFQYALIILVLLLLWMIPFLIIQDENHKLIFSDLSLPLYNIAATAALGVAALKSYPHNRWVGRFWLILAVAQFCWTIADSAWAYIELWIQQYPFPSLADIFYLAYYPIFLAAILHMPFVTRTPADRLKLRLEVAIIIVSAGLFLWSLIIGPIIAQSGVSEPLLLAFSVAYPVADLLLLLAVLVMLFRKPASIPSGPIVMVAIGALVTILTDTLFIISDLQDTFSSSDLVNLGYLLSYILIGMAGVHQARLVSVRQPDAAQAPLTLTDYQPGFLHSLVPAATLISAYLLLIASYRVQLSLSFTNLAFWVGVLLVLAISLQQVISRENLWLTKSLVRINQELEQKVKQRTAELSDTNRNLQEEINTRLRITETLQVNEALYRAVVEDIPLFICRFLPDGTLTFVNEAYCTYFKLNRLDLIGQSFFKLIPQEDQAYVRERFMSLTQDSPVVKYEHRVFNPDGELSWQRWIDRAVYESGQLVEYQSIGEDISEQRLSELALRESEEKFRDLFNSSTNLIQIISPEARFIYVNQAWKNAMGYTDTEIAQLSLWDIIHPDHISGCQQAFQQTLDGVSNFNCEAVFLTRDGKAIQVEGNSNCKYKEGKPEYVRGIFHDVTQRKLAEQQLIHNAYYDSLTSLPNRAMLMEYLRQTVENKRRDENYQYAVLFLDLDNFKLVNDSLGHPVGDRLLIAIAERLQGSIRAQDLVARLSGDEFIILLDGITNQDDAVMVANRVLDEMRKPLEIEQHQIVISVSIGIVFGTPGTNDEDNLRDADIAMYRAKKRGKNCYEIFAEGMREEAVERLHLENDLRNAFQRGEFTLYYQPIVALDDRRITGFEALLRWNNPKMGVVGPVELIPVLEETGLIIDLGNWILYEACLHMADWQTRFPQKPPLIVSVNLISRQLAQKDFSHQILKVLNETGLDPTCLALEITESMLMEDIVLASDLLESMSRLGVKIHIDDFGTGYSSLGRLQNLPISTIKIDRSFINEINPLVQNQDVVRAISIMSQELGLEMIAEGIEHNYQSEYLLNLGCRLGQGYYFARPVPRELVPQLLEKPILLDTHPTVPNEVTYSTVQRSPSTHEIKTF